MLKFNYSEEHYEMHYFVEAVTPNKLLKRPECLYGSDLIVYLTPEKQVRQISNILTSAVKQVRQKQDSIAFLASSTV